MHKIKEGHEGRAMVRAENVKRGLVDNFDDKNSRLLCLSWSGLFWTCTGSTHTDSEPVSRQPPGMRVAARPKRGPRRGSNLSSALACKTFALMKSGMISDILHLHIWIHRSWSVAYEFMIMKSYMNSYEYVREFSAVKNIVNHPIISWWIGIHRVTVTWYEIMVELEFIPQP